MRRKCILGSANPPLRDGYLDTLHFSFNYFSQFMLWEKSGNGGLNSKMGAQMSHDDNRDDENGHGEE